MKLGIRWMFQIKTWLYIAYLLVATATLLLMVELSLAGLDSSTGGKYPVLAFDEYPSKPDQYYKIAVFGESSARGYGAERGFADMVAWELARRYPDRKFYIHNYARPGTFFHGYMAEIVKANIDRYDLLLIYAGQGEVHTFLDAAGLFRKQEFKQYRQIVRLPGDDMSLFTRILDYHSRIYAMVVRKKAEEMNKRVEAAGGLNAHVVFPEFARESEGLVPPADRETMIRNYKQDVAEIARLSDKMGTPVILFSAVSNQDWTPCFSLLGNALSPDRRLNWQNEFNTGTAEYNRGRYAEALGPLVKACEIDQGVAIVNFLTALAHRMVGNKEESRRFLRLASDTDGYAARALTAYVPAAAEIAGKSRNLRFFDSITAFESVVDRGYEWEQLFVDIHHPSLMGHAILAQAMLAKIVDLPEFKATGNRIPLVDLDTADFNQLAEFYRQALNVTPEDEARTALVRASWFLMFSDLSAYPEHVFGRAERDLGVFREKAGPGRFDVEGIFARGMANLQSKRASRLGQ